MRRTVVIVGTTFALTFATLASLLLLSTSPADACTPPNTLTITGPARGTINTEYTFTATVAPDSTTLPLTYRWTAGQATSTGGMHYQNRGLTDTWSFTWAVSGTDTIRVMAAACDRQVQAVYTFTIPIAVGNVAISGPVEGMTGTAYSFTAVVSPVTATKPITYTWIPAPDAGQGAETVTYTWATTGSKQITVTAENADTVATGTHQLIAQPTRTHIRYLPLVFSNTNVEHPSDTTGALAYINYYRDMAGIPPVRENEELSYGAWLHSRYMVKNDIVAHHEDRSNPWYTDAGHSAAQLSNLLGAHDVATPDTVAIDSWMQGPFHALGILDPQLADVGYGVYREEDGGIQAGFALNVIQGISYTLQPTYPIMWPSTTISLTEHYGEWPNPLTSCGYEVPSGLPIILQIGSGNRVPEVTDSTFEGQDGPLPHCTFDETTYSHPDEAVQEYARRILDSRDAIVLIPREPLTPGDSYTASITTNGETYTWTFTVAEEAATHAASRRLDFIPR